MHPSMAVQELHHVEGYVLDGLAIDSEVPAFFVCIPLFAYYAARE